MYRPNLRCRQDQPLQTHTIPQFQPDRLLGRDDGVLVERVVGSEDEQCRVSDGEGDDAVGELFDVEGFVEGEFLITGEQSDLPKRLQL